MWSGGCCRGCEVRERDLVVVWSWDRGGCDQMVFGFAITWRLSYSESCVFLGMNALCLSSLLITLVCHCSVTMRKTSGRYCPDRYYAKDV